jgi:alanyl-tRNA synthetase
MNSTAVRSTFLEYFREHGHPIVPSSSVVPHGDKTLLFTNAGMVQFKDIFTGARPRPEIPRAATAQKCIRAGGKHNDLDNVGYTTRHLTFFEMLGNFSFGDYFKAEAIRFAWELVTERFGIDPDRLWVTVFRVDDEAAELWRATEGVRPERIVRLGEKDNFWSMGDVGPCGPCSEILVDRGPSFGEADLENGERFFEIWNLVFMQFEQRADGTRSRLPKPSIDTGMGLERMAMVLQRVDSVFDTDVLRSLIARIEQLTGTRYESGAAGAPHRVLADHIRSLSFALADGAEISNEGRGYVIRRILRRAARYGRKIWNGGPILHRLVETLVAEMGADYPEIVRQRDFIASQIESEEERFGETLDRGIQIFEDLAADLKQRGQKTVSGGDVFRLYDTFGFPADLVERMAAEVGFDVDVEGFEAAMAEQRQRSRGASAFAANPEGDEEWTTISRRAPETRFVGYRRLESEGEVTGILDRDGAVRIILDETPFYAESGGQVGDCGRIAGSDVELRVTDTRKDQGRFVHFCEVIAGESRSLAVGSRVRAGVDAERRRAIARHHSATHLLHAALRRVLGTHVHQKGSLVAPERLRFDVTHFQAIGPDELDAAARIVRDQILENLPVEISEMPKDDAIAAGAMAFFGEKYGDRVRVVRMGDFSMELCGGTHVSSTGELGPFVVAHEGSVSSGVRRVEALVAHGADEFYAARQRLLDDACRRLKTRPEALAERIDRLLAKVAELESKAKQQPSQGGADTLRRERLGDILIVAGVLDGVPAKELRGVYDGFKSESERLIGILITRENEKAAVLVTVSKALESEGWSANELFQAGAETLGARGGGRAGMVQAGGSRPNAAADALERMLVAVRSRQR